MIRRFIVQAYAFGSFKTNQRGVTVWEPPMNILRKRNRRRYTWTCERRKKQNVRHMVTRMRMRGVP